MTLAPPFNAAALLDELERALRIEGGRTVADLLEDAGTLAIAREDCVRVAGPLIAEFARDPAFAAWLKAI